MTERDGAGLDLFAGTLSAGGCAAEVGSTGWLRAMLDVEAALARAGAVAGTVPTRAAAAITAACADVRAYDAAALGAASARSGNPVVELVRAIERAVTAGGDPDSGRHVHQGATSQDVVDTAAVLVARRAGAHLLTDLDRCVAASAGLARAHGRSVMSGRTLLQRAAPTTFGLVATGWATALDGARGRVRGVLADLPVQHGGAVGTLAASAGHGAQVRAQLALELGLRDPGHAWHTARLPVADVAGALGTASGVLAKVAGDVLLLSQDEIGEVSEIAPGRGGSSTMPHKRNAVAAVSARAGSRRAPGLVATLLSAMEQEHQRAAGAWHSEWETWSDLLRCTGSAASWAAESLECLQVDPDVMRRNLDASLGSWAAEGVAAELFSALGRDDGHRRVAAAARRSAQDRRPLREVLTEDADVAQIIAPARLDVLFDPLSGLTEALQDMHVRLADLDGDTP